MIKFVKLTPLYFDQKSVRREDLPIYVNYKFIVSFGYSDKFMNLVEVYLISRETAMLVKESVEEILSQF